MKTKKKASKKKVITRYLETSNTYERATSKMPGKLNGHYSFAYRTKDRKTVLALKKWAKEEERTMNNLISMIITKALKSKKKI